MVKRLGLVRAVDDQLLYLQQWAAPLQSKSHHMLYTNLMIKGLQVLIQRVIDLLQSGTLINSPDLTLSLIFSKKNGSLRPGSDAILFMSH